jgi:beta-galactosidase
MQRREFLKISLLAPVAGLALPELALGKEASGAEPIADGRPHRFTLSRQSFLLDGKPFQIRSGEMHPIRIPAEYWLHRIRMAKAMGLNTIAVYIMWNAFEQEPGVFDLKTGSRDFAHFIRLCQQEGMWVYLRPGPYVCAEWDFGGLPPYLLRDPNSHVRHKDDAGYMAGVRRYLDAVAPVVKPLMASAGGPILMVQVENEYASFGNDLDYLKLLHAMWKERGIDGPFSISDGLGQIQKQQTYLPGTALGLDGDTDFAAAQLIAGEAPVWVGEGYPGWLTHWGDPKLQSADYANTLNELLQQKRSFNLYVVHGGTNFGFGAGANANKDYSNFEPVITSYDYGAPINERGEATADFYRFRELIARHVAHKISDIPAPPPAITFDAATPVVHASIWDNLGTPRQVSHPQPNEILLAQDHGMVLYRKRLPAGGTLHIDDVRDYVTIFSDGRYLDAISRVRKPGVRDVSQIDVPAGELDILIDSFGHIGYGQAMADRKGIVGEVRLGELPLEDWSVYGLPLNDAFIASLKPLAGPSRRPGLFFKLNVSLKTPGDTYIDMSGWGKGYVWVNGQLLGRYWHIGPQQRLYCPAPWLRAGANEIVVFDMHRVDAAPVRGVTRLAG